ncbi:MAG: nicotinamidase [Chloroflexota bacterium]
MSYPKFYDSAKVGTLFVPDVESATTAGSEVHLPVDEDNQYDAALLLIDAQVDFIHENGALSVPGAVDDTRRTIEWLFDHMGDISAIYASLDSHLPNQIFSPSWWVDSEGNHPNPFTVITYAQVQTGEWNALYHPEWSLEYTERLEENAKKQLMIWPYHTLIGTVGHNITPALYEAIVYHSAARQITPHFITKGTVPTVEHYSIFEPEVKPSTLGDDALNSALLDELKLYDKIYVAGQAKSHCVLESVTSMMRYFDEQPDIIGKIHILTDAMSSVANPEIDFDKLANDTFSQFAEHGLQLTTTSEM